MTKEIDWHKNLILCTSMVYVRELIAGYFKTIPKNWHNPFKSVGNCKINLLKCILSSGDIISECVLVIVHR